MTSNGAPFKRNQVSQASLRKPAEGFQRDSFLRRSQRALHSIMQKKSSAASIRFASKQVLSQ